MTAKKNGESSRPAGPIIRVVDVRKTFREGTSRTDALRGISFDIMPGEFCTIIGRSGSGKSTLLNMLAGLDHPTKGQIVILGRHIERMSESELVDFRLQHVGFVFQSYNLFPSYDALDNVAMPLIYRGMNKAQRDRRARKMIKAVGLLHRMHHTPNKMSGGEQQRIGIARALVSNPQIIFADEPTGNLDVKTSARVLRLMTDVVHERGTTLIMVTHDPEMSRYADRVIRLLDGDVIENSVNENPEPISAPDDDGQDWAGGAAKPAAKPAKKQAPARRHWWSKRRAEESVPAGDAARQDSGQAATVQPDNAEEKPASAAATAENAMQGDAPETAQPETAATAESVWQKPADEETHENGTDAADGQRVDEGDG